MAKWDPGQYGRFGDQRLRPALDLLERVPHSDPRSIWDLGCGTGNVTQIICQRWPNATVVGMDSSAEMLAKAKSISNVTWIEGDISKWAPPEATDLIYSNATLHWLPEHHLLFPRLVRQLRAGGVLAVQMPRNGKASSHQAILAAVECGSWREALEPVVASMPMTEDPSSYYAWLNDLVGKLDIWETEYLHVLEGDNAVAEWTRGSVLKPFLDALAPDQRSEFFEEYAGRVNLVYPKQSDGRTLFPFRRLFLVAQR
ncbi:trans-aconitate methyltransferase [Bradyrhizobium sp. LTSP885]|uniref:methyltransferase domain-containing protein n=1 Tax=Bradyrhizobium sp. LTSP885 TaxID=1619232 RepID=UPI0005CA6401|nr:methyltransferase domain-containing protein [Bradyrhizobium sp. LTSP885]KJC50479.1 trans-aconitate methyltransferase [Bradyrhizobium sp. LTSP885]